MFIFKKNKVAQGYSVVPVISSLSRIIKLNELLNKTTCTGVSIRKDFYLLLLFLKILRTNILTHILNKKKKT